MTINYPKPVIGFAAYSGTGKTTLLTQLIPILRDKGLRVAVIKHAHHDFDIDQPGKDSYQLRKAGASPMLISSSRRMALM
ncbi:MAG: molybdopterin-guanine dinucleotide biosynthesis protein B, partial [Gammaproteobacteria bacterium]|nr:molybdopterin-guanine dinucleotide biosynthesis protein B [Gammaproteobacteria bacterium]